MNCIACNSTRRAAWTLLASVLLVSASCKSRNTTKDLPQTIESTVTATAPAADSISYIEVSPWQVEPGGSIQVKAGGTADRSGKVTLTGLAGEGAGREFTKAMQETPPGVYVAEFAGTENLPAGEYRVEVELSGGPGAPAKLTSSRKLAIVRRPTVDAVAVACAEARTAFQSQPLAQFEFNRDDLTPAARAAIDAAAQRIEPFLAKLQSLTVEGHCDERGSLEYNLALGARRARAVQQALAAKLGSAVTIGTVSYGETRPVIPNAASEADHARNRRAMAELICR